MRTRKGSVLVIALWVIGALAAAAVAMSGYLSTETRLVRYNLARAQARAWARGGVILALTRLALDAQPAQEPFDWLGDEDWALMTGAATTPVDRATWRVALKPSSAGGLPGAGRVEITITDEERRLPLRTATLEMMTQLLGDAQAAQAIVDYQDADTTGSFEDDLTAQPPYRVKNAAAEALEELLMLRPFQERPELRPPLLEDASVYTSGPVNVNTVSAPAWKALVAADPAAHQLIDVIVQARDQAVGTTRTCHATSQSTAAQELADCALMGNVAPVIALLSQFGAIGFGVRSSVFRIATEGVVTLASTEVSSRVEAVVQRAAASPEAITIDAVAFRLLAWREAP